MWDTTDRNMAGGVSVFVNGNSVVLEDSSNAPMNWSADPTIDKPVKQSETNDAGDSYFRVIRVFGSGPLKPAMERPKISVTFRASNAGKTEEERSSSGASSGPASDCEDDDVKPNVCQLVVRPVDNKGREEWQTKFHVKELDADQPEVVNNKSEVIVSGQGSVRGLKNRVRASIVSLLEHQASKRNYDKEEEGRIVFYTTTMGVVRQTYEQCRRVRKILETLLVKFEERDVFMNRDFQHELKERLGITHVLVPHVFVEGRLLGNADALEQLNETGELRQILRPYKRTSFSGTCSKCGGYKYLLCPYCGGSKKSSNHRHHFPTDQISLRCTSCDESGLIRCDWCINGEG